MRKRLISGTYFWLSHLLCGLEQVSSKVLDSYLYNEGTGISL